MANEEKIPNRCAWSFGSEIGIYDVLKHKQFLIRHYMSMMIRKVSKMFEWKNLPKTIPAFELERMLQLNGFAVIAKVDNPTRGEAGLYALYGGLGGIFDAYHKPTEAIVNNAYLVYNKVLKIHKDCVLILNDLNYEGLYVLYEKYATLLAEADLTFNVMIKQSRVPYILYAENSDIKMALDDYLSSIDKGELGYVLGTRIKHMENGDPPQIDTKQYSSTSSAELMKANIELRQYLLAQFYREIGLRDSFNMKREALSDGEIKLGEDTLYPAIDEMKEMRELGTKEVNEMFGEDWSVDFQSVWQTNQEEKDLLLESLENQAKEGVEQNQVEEEKVEEKKEVTEDE